MKCFVVGCAQGERRIDGLPTNRELRLFSVAEIAEELIAFRDVEFEAIRTDEIPAWAGHRNAQLTVHRPNITVTFGRLEVGRTQRLSRSGQWIGLIVCGFLAVFTTDSERKRSCRQVPKVAVDFAVLQGQRGITAVVSRNKDRLEDGGISPSKQTGAINAPAKH